MYIDEIDYDFVDWDLKEIKVPPGREGHANIDTITCFEKGQFPGVKGQWVAVPTYNEATDEVCNCHYIVYINRQGGIGNSEVIAPDLGYLGQNPGRDVFCPPKACQPNLLYIFKEVVQRLGYRLQYNTLEGTFAEHIYIATFNTSKSRTGRIYTGSWGDDGKALDGILRMALPHWTAEEFIKEFQKFFNVTVRFDDMAGTVDIVKEIYSQNIVDITHTVTREYNVEIIEDEDSGNNLANANLVYAQSGSEYHQLDMVDEEILESFVQVEKESYDEIIADYDGSTPDERYKKVWKCPTGIYVAYPGNGKKVIRTNHFGKLWRNSEADDIELKIVPCAIANMDVIRDEIYAEGHSSIGTTGVNLYTHVLCLSNDYQEGREDSTVYDAIMNQERQEENEKEDVIQVFMIDDRNHLIQQLAATKIPYPVPFTDYEPTNTDLFAFDFERWSLALDHSGASEYIGGLHARSQPQNRNAEYRISFYSEGLPSPYDIYMVNNKRFACKKLEVTFTEKGRGKIVAGYFAELL